MLLLLTPLLIWGQVRPRVTSCVLPGGLQYLRVALPVFSASAELTSLVAAAEGSTLPRRHWYAHCGWLFVLGHLP